MHVAGQLNKRLDTHGLYKTACKDLAETLGWQASALFTHWKELAMMREFEQKWPRAVCEWMALQDLYACFHKVGKQDFN